MERHIFWGNRRVSGGVLTPGGTAWLSGVQWGGTSTPTGQNIVWGENCAGDCDNIVWGNNIVWGESDGDDNIVWGNSSLTDNITWGSSADDFAEYGDDTAEIESFDPSVWEDLFEIPLMFTTSTTSGGGAQ